MQKKLILWLTLGLAPLSVSVSAHTPQGMKSCADIENVDARVACYDKAMERIESSDSVESVVSERGSGKQKEKEKAKAKDTAITATITGVTELTRGNFQISLDNGEVWRENRPDRGSSYKVGDRITITEGSLSSHRLKSHRTGLINKVHKIE